jgi:hypothetical protein
VSLDWETAFLYQVYGLRLWNHRMIPGLVNLPMADARPGDLRIELAGSGVQVKPPLHPMHVLIVSPGHDERGEPYFKVCRLDERKDAAVQLCWNNGDSHLEFRIDRVGGWACATWSESVPYPDVVSSLLGPVLGCVLRLRGVTCLHASAIAVGSVAIAIVGSKFGGKSTLAANFAESGYAVLADDVAALTESEGGMFVQPGPARLRLWPNSVEALPGVEFETLDRVSMNLDKRYLDLTLNPDASRWRYQSEPLPLAAVYLLDEPDPPGSAPHVTPIPPAAGLISLTQNTYVDYVLDRAGRARDFQVLGRLAVSIPLRRVHRPSGLDALPQTCAVILDDLQAIRHPSATENREEK